jgi:hypothetical protein
LNLWYAWTLGGIGLAWLAIILISLLMRPFRRCVSDRDDLRLAVPPHADRELLRAASRLAAVVLDLFLGQRRFHEMAAARRIVKIPDLRAA